MTEVIDQDEQGNRATPETLAKLQPDPFRLLYTKGRLDGNPHLNLLMYDAGDEIARAFRLITQPVAMRGTDYTREVRGGSYEAREQALVRNEALVRRYVAWVDRMNERLLPIGPILDILIDGQGCQATDRFRRRGTGYTGKILRQGLRLYCEVAGWVRTRAA